MNHSRIIEIFETLLNGYSPTTGESLDSNVILNDREIIRAFTITLLRLKELYPNEEESIREIDKNDFLIAVNTFKSYNVNVTERRIKNFFSGVKLNEDIQLNTHFLFGKYSEVLSTKAISDSVKELMNTFFEENPRTRDNKWSHISFFEEAKFNHLSINDIQHFSSQVSSLGILKSKDLSDFVVDSRVNYKRAYEPWSEKEIVILKDLIAKTNDLDILTQIFQRGPGGVSAQAKRLIYLGLEINES